MEGVVCELWVRGGVGGVFFSHSVRRGGEYGAIPLLPHPNNQSNRLAEEYPPATQHGKSSPRGNDSACHAWWPSLSLSHLPGGVQGTDEGTDPKPGRAGRGHLGHARIRHFFFLFVLPHPLFFVRCAR